MKQPTIILILVIIFTLLNAVDIITALYIGPAETNPVFNAVGGLWPVLLIKIALCAAVWCLYIFNYYQTRFLYYTFIFILLEGSIMLLYGITLNVNAIMNPEIIVAAASMPTQAKTKQYFDLMQYFYIFPMIMSSITFLIFNSTHKKVKFKLPYNMDSKIQKESFERQG